MKGKCAALYFFGLALLPVIKRNRVHWLLKKSLLRCGTIPLYLLITHNIINLYHYLLSATVSLQYDQCRPLHYASYAAALPLPYLTFGVDVTRRQTIQR